MDEQPGTRSSRERAVSSEPCSTRPNPFDNDEHLARKRRRTSLSGGASPSRSSGLGTEASLLGLNTLREDQAPADDVEMSLEPGKAPPRTPERYTGRPGTTTESVSRRVTTINLRNTQAPATAATLSSPLSSTGHDVVTNMDGSDDAKLSVDLSEMDGAQLEMQPPTPTSSAADDDGSPPVEAVGPSEDEESPRMDEPQILVMKSRQNGDARVHKRPPSFPYRSEDEHQQESLQRVNNHILTHEKMTAAMARYLEDYPAFARGASLAAQLDAYLEYKCIWQGLPDIISCALIRRSTVRDRDVRAILPSIFSAFAAVTASFLILDFATIQRAAELPDSEPPDLITPYYFPILNQLCAGDETTVPGQYALPFDVSAVLDSFSNCLGKYGGAFSYLHRFAQAQIALLGRWPRLSENLHSICQLFAWIATLENRRLPIKNHLQAHLIYEFYSNMAEALSLLVEKGITNLSHESTGLLIKCLAEVLAMALGNPEHPGAIKLVEDFRKTQPLIQPDLIPEVLASRYRFLMYGRLIMSSQMQLRVMAVTSMCSDMVACWKRFSEPANDPRNLAVQRYFADFLLKSDLISYILGPTCHPEITSESGNIIGFLLVTNTYTDEHTDLLWQTVTTTKDPRISEALLRMFSRIAQLLHYDGLLYFCQKIDTLPIEGFTPAVRDLMDSILRWIVQKSPYDRVETAPYRLCLRLMRESSAISTRSNVAYPEVREFANAKFRELLSHGPDAEGRSALYEECIQDVASKSRTTMGSLSAIGHLMYPNRARELPMLVAKYSFAELLVDELEHAVSTSRTAGNPAVIEGQQNGPRREIMNLLLQNQPQALAAPELGHRLWKLLVGSEASCPEDRDASWRILNTCKKTNPENEFVATCWTTYLPSLPSEFLCSGTLDLIRLCILPAVNSLTCEMLDDQESPDWAAIEQIWRMILTTNDSSLEEAAIKTLVSDIYLNSGSIRGFPRYRARKVHLAFVNRCLDQLFSAAERLRAIGDDDSTRDEQSLRFVRSLKVLNTFHQLYSEMAHFATPDLRSLSLVPSHEVEGDSAELKFQSFDGETQTEVKTLTIGRLNTASSLLASLKEATGFENYRVFFRGKPFLPREADVCKSLEDLRIHDGFLLVKRESVSGPRARIRAGASPVEVEILAHFDKFWDCLGMEEPLAREIYSFLAKLPPDEKVLGAILDPSTDSASIFPPGQTFKSLYAVSAMNNIAQSRFRTPYSGAKTEASSQPLEDISDRVSMLAVAAISSADVIEGCPTKATRVHMIKTICTIITAVLERCVLSQFSRSDAEESQLTSRVVQNLSGDLLRRLVSLLASSGDSRQNDETSGLAVELFHAILECAVSKRDCWEAFAESDQIQEQIKRLILDDDDDDVRNCAQNAIMKLFNERMNLPAVSPPEVEQFFWELCCQLVVAAKDERIKSRESFELWRELVRSMKDSGSPILDLQALLDMATEMLLAYETWEDITKAESCDAVPQVLAQILVMVLSSPEALSSDRGLHILNDLHEQIFWKHLFPPWTDETERTSARPVIHPATRQYLNHVIMLCIGNKKTRLATVLEALKNLVPCESITDEDPYHYDIPFNFDRSRAIRSPCGYAGLRNLSNTCYLNSLFTQLFMNVRFRQFMLSSRVHDKEGSQRLLFTTQKVFANLQDSHHRFIDPSECVESIRTYDDTQIDIHNQMDVDEFYNLLFDRWEAQLPTTESKRAFRSFYGGQLVQQVRSQECEHISERLEPFSAIQCDIKGKSSLQESLEAYVEGEIMGGDNKYKCSTCDRHVDAVKRACLKDIPDDLIFHLKRFDFNLRSLTRNKINDFFSFPTRLDMRPYTVEHLANPSEAGPPDMFELVGVLVHSGTAESGHYYSYIRERPANGSQETWVEFNDDMVSSWDSQNLQASCFGGTEYRAGFEGGNQTFDKNYSAYMLFYQRSSAVAQEQEMLASSAEPGPLRAKVPEELAAHIRHENTLLLRRHCLFDTSHVGFVTQCLVMASRYRAGEETAKWTRLDQDAVEMAVGHLDQVASRTKDLPDFNKLWTHIAACCQESEEFSAAVLRYFSDRPMAFQRMVQRSPDAHARKVTSQLVMTVIENMRFRWVNCPGASPEQALSRLDERCYLRQAMRLIDQLWVQFHVHLRSWPEVFGFMLAFVRLGPLEKGLFLDHDLLCKLILVIAAEPNEGLPQFARMAQTVSRRLANRQPKYENVISLIAELLGSMQGPRMMEVDADGNERQTVKSRLYAALQEPERPLEMTTNEILLIGREWHRSNTNIFLDKLLTLGQNMEATQDIIAALVRISPFTQTKVVDTLIAGINGAPVSYKVEPFLRGAAVYCRASRDKARVKELFLHVCEQGRNVQNSSGASFLEFHQDVFQDLDLSGRERALDFPADGLANVHRWAPGLLNYYESQVAYEVYDFIKTEVFEVGLARECSEDALSAAHMTAASLAARRLAWECVRFLRDQYVNKQQQCQHQTGILFERVLRDCDAFFPEVRSENAETLAVTPGDVEAYWATKLEVLQRLQELMVEEIEDEGSEWENSCGSSEPMESLGDFTMQTTGELTEADLQ